MIKTTKTKVKNIRVEAREWFDKVNGNSYFSARAYVNGELVAIAPFQYGYGEYYLQEISEILETKGYMPKDNWRIARFCRENGIEFSTSIVTTLKRDVVAFGKGEL